ncbi:hypothetical protein Hanom_Chr13g01201001 [Helianthus anomalus]
MRERTIAFNRLTEMQAAYDEARRRDRWDKKRECYTDLQGNPVVDSSSVNFEAPVEVIPTSGEYYSNKFNDNNYIQTWKRR